MAHQSVLLKELITGLAIKRGDSVVDATVNGGGVSALICEQHPNIKRLICIDLDREALKSARERLYPCKVSITFIESNFRLIDRVLAEIKIKGVDRVVFDLGISSNQLENSGRGFSFTKNEPLLMTFKEKPGLEELTARDIVNDWQEENLAIIIKSYGEDRNARKIANAIVQAREEKPIKTSKELREIIEKAFGKRRGRIHPATKTFQALRIAVNDELGSLLEALEKSFSILSRNGRIVVISFHSLEDRIVKRFMRAKAKNGEGLVVNKKPIRPSEIEIKNNPRARSAKLRIIEKI